MRFMVVDDKVSMVRTIVHMLRKLGYERTVTADDGDSALMKLRGGEHVTFIVSDWNMPRMTGVELLQAVREEERLKDLPFIMITAETDYDTVAQAGEVDVDGYLLKPFTLEALKTRIEQVWEKRASPSPVETHINLAQVYIKAR
ncbi:MAG: response regulator, partial [Proteobacteria bacterium]|nr:response regulator [Pseudomonadota bacterium]